jgi:hypothetical protein
MLMKRNSSFHFKSCKYTFSKCVYLVLVIGVAMQYYSNMRGESVIDRDMWRESDDNSPTNDCGDLQVHTARSQSNLHSA